NASRRLTQLARAVRRSDEWKARAAVEEGLNPAVLLGAIAAGEVVIGARGPLYTFIRENYNDALAVEMEGRGFLEAVHANESLSAVVVRGISDRIADKNPLDDAVWQPRAARHAAGFAFEL